MPPNIRGNLSQGLGTPCYFDFSVKRLVVTVWIAALAGVASGQQAIFLVRHAEKATDSNDPGVALSEAGTARANRLAGMLKAAGITAVYATDTVRARKTAEPLAKSAGLEIRIYAPKENLVDRLRKEEPRGVVLVVGHSNTVPELLAGLGDPGKVEIPAAQYDDLFVVVPRADGPPSVVRLKY
jgi:phosphohistidine phosphatase SixA